MTNEARARSRRRSVRLAGLVLVAVLAAATLLTYLAYNDAFADTKTITVLAPRAGLVTEEGGKVKFHGLQIGKIKSISYASEQAKLELAVNAKDLRQIPSNATVRIAGTTIFGAKSVEFLVPQQPSGSSLRPGATVTAEAVALEVNTVFENLTRLLGKIDPVNLNATLTAIGEGLRGNGDNFGQGLVELDQYLDQLNPKLPTLQQDFRKAGQVGQIYGDSAQDIVRILDNVPTLSRTIVDEQQELKATLLAAIGVGNSGYETLAPAEKDLTAALQRLRAPATLLGRYSPEFPCLFKAISKALVTFAPLIGGVRPGLFLSNSFPLGAPVYTYPESLPVVNGSGGPNCRGLPDIPTKTQNGSWYRAPFLVTDNAYIPYEPLTELQVNAPDTLQYLYGGAFAKRSDF
ncbi:MCE family protein [Mycobacterium sp. CBMA271]|uniref:MCE family protein n=1 Tax=unclassified Mycobacteroides TaxID=2618759 RepID=UPI0012DBDCC9|nr:MULTISPECIES: MCE family protein [unclassified Mycobacteroides]MUM19382.1 MCE-family protein [Mycobacteroides sp. CBMA 326]MUM21208.1 MCE family protein [Mycobacteroides sp. CBMA 271]